MRTDSEYTISAAAIRLYDLGVDVSSTNQLERELWHAMRPFISVRRSVFRRAAKHVLWRDSLVKIDDDMLENATVVADDPCHRIRKTVLFFAMDLLEEFLNRLFPEPDLEPVYARMYLTLGNLAQELGLYDKAIWPVKKPWTVPRSLATTILVMAAINSCAARRILAWLLSIKTLRTSSKRKALSDKHWTACSY